MERKKNKLIRIIILLILCIIPLQIYSQLRIKEKVLINPSARTLRLSKTTTDYNPLVFGFGGPRPFSFSVSGPGGSISGENNGSGEPNSEGSLPAINGEYRVTITSGCECNSNVGFWVTWLDPAGWIQWIAGYEMWFYGQQTQVGTFTFDLIPEPPPPPPPFDFTLTLDQHQIYRSDASLIKFEYNADSEPKDKNVSVRFETVDPDIYFFDAMNWVEFGNSFTASLDDNNRYWVQCRISNNPFPKKVKVIATSNGIERSDTLTILQSEYIRAYFEKENLSAGDTVGRKSFFLRRNFLKNNFYSISNFYRIYTFHTV